jgi:hypothetical protein
MSDVLTKSLEELINTMTAASIPESFVEQKKMAATKILIEKLITSIDTNAKESDKLANRVFWLNVVLTGATVAGVVIAFFKP